MFILLMSLTIAMADDFAITESAELNPHQQHFIATVNQNRVLYKAGLQRYKSRTYKNTIGHIVVLKPVPILNRSYRMQPIPMFFFGGKSK